MMAGEIKTIWVTSPDLFTKKKISKSIDAYEYILDMCDFDRIDYKEFFYVIFLNRANITKGWYKVSEGGTAGTVCDPKDVFGTALKHGASAIILAHNHPSGIVQPSESDIHLTKRMVECGKILECPVVDHIVFTSDDFYSFADNGII